MLLTEFHKDSIAALEHLYPTAEARSIVFLLCEHLLGTKNYTHILDPLYKVDKHKQKPLAEAMERLRDGEPIQYVIGTAEFCGFTFKVDSRVLIPRAETELLCREAIKIASRIKRMRIPYGKSAQPVRVLDLCTGSGNIAWVVALSVPGAKVVAVDNSEAALQVARSQNFSSMLKERGAIAPVFVNADILQTEQDFKYGEFDLILSNPPYIMESEKPLLRKNVLDFEPSSALFVGDDDPLIYYRAIAKWSEYYLSQDGKCLTEINEALGKQTLELFRKSGFSSAELIKDFYDKDRFILYMK